MRTCWAAALGDCSGALSKEHLVSRAVLELVAPDNILTVGGFRWCEGKDCKISVGTAVARVLCETHNSRLSPSDAEGLVLFQAIREISRLNGVRAGLNPTRWRIHRFEVGGVQFERWLLKTAINFIVSQGPTLSWHGASSGGVPLPLVEASFSQGELGDPMGVYLAGSPSALYQTVGGFGFRPLFSRGGAVIGALLEVPGLRFVLWLTTASPPDDLAVLHGLDAAWRSATLYHHPQSIATTIDKYASTVLRFRGWAGEMLRVGYRSQLGG